MSSDDPSQAGKGTGQPVSLIPATKEEGAAAARKAKAAAARKARADAADRARRDRQKVDRRKLFIERVAWAVAFFIALALFWSPEKRVWLPLTCLVSCVIGFFLSLRSASSDGSAQGQLEWFSDVRRSFLSVFTLLEIVLGLMALKILIKPSDAGFEEAKVDWFLVVVSIVGIVGATWAILAKVDAHKAFQSAQEAFISSQDALAEAQIAAEEAHEAREAAQRTFNSIAGSFKFESLLSEAESMLGYHLRQAENGATDLILFLGVPAVGFFRPETREQGLAFMLTLVNVLNSRRKVVADDESAPRWMFVCIDPDFINEKLSAETNISDQVKNRYRQEQELLKDTLGSLASDYPNSFSYKFIKRETGIRFAITRKPRDEESQRAAVWVVSNFFLGCEGQLESFKSAGFKTRDIDIIDSLEKLCENYIQTPDGDDVVEPATTDPAGPTQIVPPAEEQRLQTTKKEGE